MNRTLYKVVFNKHRNCMMAVAENAKREGKKHGRHPGCRYFAK